MNTPMSDTQEKQTQEIYRVMQLPYLSERHDGIKQLIDSAKREAISELGKLMSSGLMQRAWIPELDKYYDDRIAQLEQSEESI